MLHTFHFNLPGITCINCVKPVEDALAECQAIRVISQATDVFSKKITITIELDNHTLAEASEILRKEIEGTGVDCYEVQEASANKQVVIPILNDPSFQPKTLTVQSSRRIITSHIVQGIIGSAAGIAMTTLMLGEFITSMLVMHVLIGVGVLLTLILGAGSYFDATKKLIKNRTLTMDALFTISTLAIIAESIASFFVPQLKMCIDSALFIFGFRHLGLALEESVKQKVISGMLFKERAAPLVQKKILRDNFIVWEATPSSEIDVGDIIRVTSNEVSPIDGVCKTASTMIYKTILTGETFPASLKEGDIVLAGMKVPPDVKFIELLVSKPASQSHLAKLDAKVSLANIEKSPIEIIANKMLQYFISGIVFVTIVSALIIYYIYKNTSLVIDATTSLLVSACPCTLGLITPLAVKIGMTKALENGIQFKSSKTLQAAYNIDTVVFDLRGTLTSGNPQVLSTKIFAKKSMSSSRFFNYLYAIERASQHPIAKAIAEYAYPKLDEQALLNVSSVDMSNHNGIKAIVEGEECLLGNVDFLEELNIEAPEINLKQFNTIYFVKSNIVIGAIEIVDPLRQDALLTIKKLTSMGKNVHICTGSDEVTALHYADQLNIAHQNVHAKCLGDSDVHGARTKSQIIGHLQQNNKKRVAMVGDAGNDVLAIVNSDFGVAIKSHSGEMDTQEQAGAVIDNSTLTIVITLFNIANQTVRNIKQNLIISLVYNILMLLTEEIAVTVFNVAVPASIGVSLMILQMTIMLLNQNRIKNQPLPRIENKKSSEHDEKLLETSRLLSEDTTRYNTIN